MDKVVVKLGNQVVVLTNNWVIQTSAYRVDFAHQADVDLAIVGAQSLPSMEGEYAPLLLSLCVHTHPLCVSLSFALFLSFRPMYTPHTHTHRVSPPLDTYPSCGRLLLRRQRRPRSDPFRAGDECTGGRRPVCHPD